MSFKRTTTLFKPVSIWLTVVALVAVTMLPALLGQQRADALQILDRKVTMGTSQQGAETTYDVSFQVPNGAVIGGWRIELCDEDPLPGQACDSTTIEGDSVPSLDADTGSAITVTNIAFDDTAGSITNTAATCTAPGLQTAHIAGTNTTYLDVTCDTLDGVGDLAETVVAGSGTADTDYVSFTINNVNNPTNTTSGTNNDSFYVRIYTFTQDGGVGDVNTPIATYSAATPPLGNYEGGVAMSTAEQITVQARVQERLSFTVGTDTVAGDCATISGTTIDVGVLDSTDSVFNRATVNGAAATPDVSGICTEVTTNASNGATISYLTTDLQVSGATCNQANGDIDGTTAINTDQCINWEDTTPSAYVAGTENWGLGILSTPSNGTGATNNMAIVGVDYDQSSWTNTVKAEPYATSAVLLANTGGNVAAGESLLIDVAAESAITTPTGLYEATMTFIATGSF